MIKNYGNKISRMEDSKTFYTCCDCPKNFYFTHWSDFRTHECLFKLASYFECIYCGLLILWKNGEKHINSHFKNQNSNLYKCVICQFSTSSSCNLTRHISSHDESSISVFRCTGCEQSFVSASDLIKHVNVYTIPIYNCSIVNCHVKSPYKTQMCEHYKRCHPTKTITFEISLQLACSENTPDIQFTNQLLGRVPKLEHQLAISKCNTKHSPTTYLQCSKCDFSTIQWHNFIRHYFKCCYLEKPGTETHCLYLCSVCLALTTKIHIIEEHLLNCERSAKVLVEILPQRSVPEVPEVAKKEAVSNKLCKRSHSLSSSHHERTASKRQRVNESPESKCKTDEAVISDFGEEDLNLEFVSIPFDEEGFRSNNPGIPYHQKETIITKMRQFSQAQINIVGKENYGRIPECPECHKIFTYGFGDFKRHFMSVHLDIEKEYIKECLKFTRLPKGGDKFQEMQEQLAMRNLRPKALDKDKIRVPLPYSIAALRQLTEFLPLSTQQYLSEKMKAYSIMSIIIQNFDNSRRFLCNQCTYSSPYALADVRKHIMGSHCGISTKHFRYCLQASRLDPNEFTLLPDDKILNLAKDLSRRTKQKSLNHSSSPPRSRPSKKTMSPHNTRYQKWSNTAKKSRNLSTIKADNALQPSTNSHSLGGRKGVNALFLNADSNYNLNLPFSEKVLRALLQSVIPDEQISSIIQKMKLYANYSLKRLCKNERTVAFQCPCGRVFHTARIPDLKMRAATLADARRHVMGVHAKIPQTLITVCCQASRICRENDFQIYSDEMLLQLASERQGKLPDSQSRSNPCGDSSSKSQDGQVDSSADPGEQNSPINDRDLPSPIPSFLNESYLSNVDNNVPKTNSFLTSNFQDDDVHTLSDVSKEDIAADLNPEDDAPYYVISDECATSRLDCEKSKIERIIHLPYSLDALKCLTDGYCEPTFFPVLQEKMNVYSKYKIFIIRREGRRIFCCSGCPSSSPHGMGDVKKHILGVHARIPERFKAAAMHCSRLSREDTSLLPDHLLLQLAKMKWKGSVIKPLAELTEEDRIKNFSKKSWDGKSKTSTLTLKFPNYFSLVDQPLLPLDSSQDQSKDSLSTSTPKLLDESNEETYHASGDSEIVVPEDFFVEMHQRQSEVAYKCSICDYESRFVGNSKGHIVREHLGIPTHSCSICEQLFNSRASVVSHHEQDHGDLSFTIAHYGPYKIAISKINVKELTSSEVAAYSVPNGLQKCKRELDSKRNSFLQNSQELADIGGSYLA